MAQGLLTAAAEHGPSQHGPIAIALVLIAVVGGLVYLVKSRRRSDRDPGSDRTSEASDRSRER
jgi:uncharacterized membrane protein